MMKKETTSTTCPHCRKDFRDVGVISLERGITSYKWTWNEKEQQFLSEMEDGEDGELLEMRCGWCEKEIDSDAILNP